MKHIIFGSESGEYLYAELSDGDVVLYSHELAVGRGAVLSQWRTRAIVAMPLASWVRAGEELAHAEAVAIPSA